MISDGLSLNFNIMDCIICQDRGVEPLKDNTSCNCKFKYHSSCWIDYVHSTIKTKCPICRSEFIKIKKNIESTVDNRQIPIMPYTVQPSAPPNNDGVHVSYQEFQDIITQSTNSYQPATRISEQAKQDTNNLKLSKSFKILLCSIFLTIIVVLILLI